MNKYQELKEKSEGELRALLAEKRQALGELRFQVHERQLKNVRSLRTTRRFIAKVLSALRARQIG